MNYSIAIRTLGTSGDKFVRELESIKRQTVQPDKVVIYIAEGYKRPDYTIGKEEYVWVKKGMMRQRVLRYDEIDSPLILLLDDDVELADDSAEKMIKSLEEHQLDCLAAETFRNYKISLSKKIYIAITNLTFPHWGDTWGVKVHCNGSFSYNNNISKDVYMTQSAAGPAALWKKDVFKKLHLEDELWLDQLRFPYGEDMLMFNKLHKNGYRLGTHYRCGIIHLNGQSSSADFQRNPKKFHTRSMASVMIWYRICYNLKGISFLSRLRSFLAFVLKAAWLSVIHLLSAIYLLTPMIFVYYLKGLYDGIKMIHSRFFRQMPNYILKS